MTTGPVAAMLPDGRRLHLQHGPIDLVIGADGSSEEINAAYRQAAASFDNVLEDLVGELELLRMPCCAGSEEPRGAIARCMYAAATAHANRFVTPMVAVAGAVADHVLAAMVSGRRLQRAYVNNGGDIALYLAGKASFRIGICTDPQTGASAGKATITSADGIRGIATSGWRGRSHSLGIADAVTVLACNAATADAAATMIANAVNLESGAIERRPACELSPDSDLGDLLVTVGVGPLAGNEIEEALDSGCEAASGMIASGLVDAAFLALRGQFRAVGSRGRYLSEQAAEKLEAANA